MAGTAELRIRHAGGHEEAYQLSGQTLIGRDPNRVGIQLEDEAVSQVHAAVEQNTAGTWQIRDLDSGNGIFINGASVEAAILAPGVTAMIGQTQLSLASPSAAPVKVASGRASLVSARLMRQRAENRQFGVLMLCLGLLAFGMGFLLRWLF